MDLQPSGIEWEKEGMARIIWRISWPLLGLMFLNFLVGYVDIYVAGLLNSSVQAAVGFISTQYFILIILGNALGVGAVALVSQASGQGDWERVIDVTRQALLLTVTVGAALVAVVLASAPRIIRLFDLPADVGPLALDYLKIFALALLPNYVILIAGAVFRAVGKPLIAFKIMALVTALTIAGNFGLVFGMGPFPRLGAPGIAWATVFAMLAGAGCVAWVLQSPAWKPVWTARRLLSKPLARSILRVSWPAVILQAAYHGGNLAIYQILGRLGEASVSAMAAYANGLRLESVTFLPAFALNMAAGVLVGQSLGRGSIPQARAVAWRMTGAGAAVITLLAAILFIAAPQISGALSPDAAVRAETVRYLRVNLLVAPFMVCSMVLAGAMVGAGDTRGVMAIIVSAVWGIRIPAAAAFCFLLDLGAPGVWIAMAVSMTIQMGLTVWRFVRGAWARGRGSLQD